MSVETETTRQKALDALTTSGIKWVRVGKGQRFVVRIDREGHSFNALVKVASRGSAMFRTSGDDAKVAKLSGFGPDIEYVLFAVGHLNHTLEKVDAYLVPAPEVEAAVRQSHEDWRAARPNSNPSNTWVIWFGDSGAEEANRYAERWRHYRVGVSLTLRGSEPDDEGPLTIADAKRRLAKTFGVEPDDVKITINA